jgi:hypothetical protein
MASPDILQSLLATVIVIAILNSIITASLIMIFRKVKDLTNRIYSTAVTGSLYSSGSNRALNNNEQREQPYKEVLQGGGLVWISEGCEKVVVKDPYVEKMRKLYKV